VHREEHLVGRDDAPLRLERLLDVRLGRVDAAHDLDEHVDRRIAQQRLGIGREARAVELGDALFVGVADQDAHHLERRADALGEGRGVCAEEAQDASADGAAPQEAEANRIHAAIFTT
jgi:hypothetical protein